MADRRTERMLEIAKHIASLEEELKEARAEFHRLASGVNEPPAAGPLEIELATGSLPDRVLAVLARNIQPMTAPEIAGVLRLPYAVDSIRAALSKLLNREEVERVAAGLYRSVTAGGHRTVAGEDD